MCTSLLLSMATAGLSPSRVLQPTCSCAWLLQASHILEGGSFLGSTPTSFTPFVALHIHPGATWASNRLHLTRGPCRKHHSMRGPIMLLFRCRAAAALA